MHTLTNSRYLSAFILFLALIIPNPASASGQAQAILGKLSLEEKIGQLFMVYFKGPALSSELRRMIDDYHVGGVILYSAPGNIENPEQLARLNASLQEAAAITTQGLGLFISIDQEGGPVARLSSGFTRLPSAMAVAATANPANAAKAARIISEELKAVGVNVNYAPVLDVNVNPLNPIIGVRSFGSDPANVTRFGLAAQEEYARQGVICTPKHFPGHGDTSVDSHQGLPLAGHDRATLEKVDFAPFKAAIKAQAPAVMTAHVEVPAIDPAKDKPATLSAKILNVLRQELGFNGVIMSDSLGMGAVANLYGTPKAALMALAAGADVLLFGADVGHEPSEQREAFEVILRACKNGELAQARLDEAVLRVLKLKEKYGLLKAQNLAQPLSGTELRQRCASQENLKAALEIAQASLTWMGGEKPGKLIDPQGPNLFIWPQRTSKDPAEYLQAVPGLKLLRPSLDVSEPEISEALAKSGPAKRVTLVLYDSTRRPGQRKLAEALLKAYPGKLTLIYAGAPYDASLYPQAKQAIATYGDGQPSLNALLKAMLASGPFPGKLPVSLK